MNPEVERLCDELHQYIDLGPGENPAAMRAALSAVRIMRASALWDYPIGLLIEVEVQLARWFSSENTAAPDQVHDHRENLLAHLARIEDAWDRPSA
jgi:hypothetical protein